MSGREVVKPGNCQPGNCQLRDYAASTPVDLSPVPDLQDKDDQNLVTDLVNNPILPHPDPIGAFVPFHLFYPGRTWILLQLIEATDDPFLDGALQFPDLAFRGRRKLDDI